MAESFAFGEGLRCREVGFLRGCIVVGSKRGFDGRGGDAFGVQLLRDAAGAFSGTAEIVNFHGGEGFVVDGSRFFVLGDDFVDGAAQRFLRGVIGAEVGMRHGGAAQAVFKHAAQAGFGGGVSAEVIERDVGQMVGRGNADAFFAWSCAGCHEARDLGKVVMTMMMTGASAIVAVPVVLFAKRFKLNLH